MEVAARAIAGRRSKIAQESSDQRMALSEGDTRRSLGEHTNPTEELSLFRSSAFYLMKSVSRS